MDLYDPKTGRFDPTPIEDFSMWAALQRGGTNANIPLLKEFVYQWVKAVTQKTAGQRKRGKDIDWDELPRIKMGILCEAVALVLSGKLDELEEDKNDL